MRHRSIYAALIAIFATSCSAGGGDGGPVAAFSRSASQPFARRGAGPGPIVTSKFGGTIFGWAIDENGAGGILTEVTPPSGSPFKSVVETFDQTTGKITKIVRKQNGDSGNRELYVDAVLANDVGLIDDERHYGKYTRRDLYYLMAPVSKKRISGTWTRPPGRNFLIFDIADQQSNPVAVMAATKIDQVISKPPTFEVVVTDVAANKILRTLYAPHGDGVNYPYFVAEDTTTQHAYVPAANYQSQTVFIDYDIRSGRASNDFVAPPFSGPVAGLAIDSASHMMCTTTGSTYSVQMYDLKTKQQTFVGQIPKFGRGRASGQRDRGRSDRSPLYRRTTELVKGGQRNLRLRRERKRVGKLDRLRVRAIERNTSGAEQPQRLRRGPRRKSTRVLHLLSRETWPTQGRQQDNADARPASRSVARSDRASGYQSALQIRAGPREPPRAARVHLAASPSLALKRGE